MSVITINYENLENISKSASNVGAQLQGYIDDLSHKLIPKYSELTGGGTTKTNNSEYYVNQKLANLSKKKEMYSAFSQTILNLCKKAQEIDKKVAETIKGSKNDFINNHDYIETGWWIDVKNWFIDFKNSCPLFEAIGKVIDKVIMAVKTICAEIKHWYNCGGGKELIGTICAAIEAIAAIVIAVVACIPPLTLITVFCTLIPAVIAAVNAIVNVVTSEKAMIAKANGNPAWAKIYGEQDRVSDVLRETNFHDAGWNRFTNGFADVWDITEMVFDVVAIGSTVKNVANTAKEIKISAGKGRTSFGNRLKQYLTNQDSYIKDSKGKNISWRKLIQQRADDRTLRDEMGKKSMSRKAFNDWLPDIKKEAIAISGKAEKIASITKYTKKGFDFVINGELNSKDIVTGIASFSGLKIGKVVNSIDKLLVDSNLFAENASFAH